MARPCTICQHLDRPAIEQALLNGKPIRRVAADFGVTESAVRRHKDGHMQPVKEAVAQLRQAQDVDSARALVEQVRILRTTAFAILSRAEQADKLSVALAAVRETRATLELLLRLEGELDSGGVQVVLAASPEWITVRRTIAASLAPWPEARQAVARALLSLELTRA